MRRLAEVVRSGQIGDVVTFNFNCVRTLQLDKNPYLNTAWRQQPAHPGGYLSDGY